MEQWVKSDDYFGPDRRSSDQGPPEGEKERRAQEPVFVEAQEGATEGA